ncbi:NACHT domain-containing protein [Enterococcus gallinarum]|uniref:NACHT domain-containing protein n=1 Tax=Enterococcus gallinarum TaxID=1353 RepID=UPI001D17A006|nr:NACHT domain-containing protein [Enterococcus gallinarum]MCC4046608.1 NACHT domain-containing protein [Enterococcus gallinarum]
MLGELIGGALLEYNLGELSRLTVGGLVESWEHFETKYNKSFEEYFQKSFEKYNKIRTIIDSSKVEKLTEVFQPTSLQQVDREKRRSEKRRLTSDEFLPYIQSKKYVWITGHGGIGKSTLMKHTMLTILGDEKKSKNKIPVYIELRKYNHEKGKREEILDFIYHEMSCVGFNFEQNLFEYMLEQGRFLFLFDAFDEIVSDKSFKFLQELENFLTKYDKNQMIISSRFMPRGNLDNLLELHELETNGLTKYEAIEMIKKTKIEDEEIKIEFIERLTDGLFEEYESIASNPTLLLLMMNLFGENSNFPKEKSAFLLEAFTVLFNKHDGRKIGYSREFRSKNLRQGQMMKTFSAFCYLTYFDTNGSQGEFTEKYILGNLEKVIQSKVWLSEDPNVNVESLLYDFRVCMCLLYKEGERFYFVHNIFQEFFAAYYVFNSNKKFKVEFLKKYILNNPDRKDGRSRINQRLLRTTFDYIGELDNAEEQNVISYELLLPLLKMIESEPDFIDYHHLSRARKFNINISGDDIYISVRPQYAEIKEVTLNRLYRIYKNFNTSVVVGFKPRELRITMVELDELIEILRSQERLDLRFTIQTKDDKRYQKDRVILEEWDDIKDVRDISKMVREKIKGTVNINFSIGVDFIFSNNILCKLYKETAAFKRNEELLTLSSFLEKESAIREDKGELLL